MSRHCKGSRRTPSRTTRIEALAATWGLCRSCGGWRSLAHDGTVRIHDAWWAV